MLADPAAEAAVLGCILLDPHLFHDASEDLQKEDFFTPFHRDVFEAMGKAVEKGAKIEPMALQIPEKGAVLALLEAVPTTANFRHYLAIVLEKAQRRALYEAGQRLQELGGQQGDIEHDLGVAESLVLKIRRLKTSASCVSVKEVSLEVYNELEKRETVKTVRGQRSGLKGLDSLLGGFDKTELCIIAARPSCGKSALLAHILTRAAADGKRVLWSSLEMSRRQLVNRLYAMISSVPLPTILQEIPDPDEWQRLAIAAGKISGYEMMIEDSGHMTVPKLASIARRMKAESGLDLLGVDYLQLMSASGKRDNREGEIADMTRQLKLLAKELDIPVIVLSQLNRMSEMREDKRPRLSDLRESGSIEQDANKVVMLYRDVLFNAKANEDDMEILVRKNRDGPTGKVKLRFVGEKMRFTDDDGGGRNGSMDRRYDAGAREEV